MPVRGIERRLGMFDAPGPDGVAAPRGDRGDIDATKTGAFDEIGLAVAQQRVATVNGLDLHRYSVGERRSGQERGQAHGQVRPDHDLVAALRSGFAMEIRATRSQSNISWRGSSPPMFAMRSSVARKAIAAMG